MVLPTVTGASKGQHTESSRSPASTQAAYSATMSRDGMAGFLRHRPAAVRVASSSRSQIVVQATCTAACMTGDRPSVSVCWRPRLPVAIVTRLFARFSDESAGRPGVIGLGARRLRYRSTRAVAPAATAARRIRSRIATAHRLLRGCWSNGSSERPCSKRCSCRQPAWRARQCLSARR